VKSVTSAGARSLFCVSSLCTPVFIFFATLIWLNRSETVLVCFRDSLEGLSVKINDLTDYERVTVVG
jgi:hypothetical protein